MTTDIHIGFLIYPGVVQLDVTALYQVLSFPPNTHLHLIGNSKEIIQSNEGLSLLPTHTIETCPALDIIVVPGGGMGQLDVMRDEAMLKFLFEQGQAARYVVSVCTGSMILAAADLLQGYKATGHWAFQSQLALFGVDIVSERIVIDRNRITGAGVTSGLDLGLTILAQLYGNEMAKSAQLMLEYDPAPPFDAGSPEIAEDDIVKGFLEVGKPLIDAFMAQTQCMTDGQAL